MYGRIEQGTAAWVCLAALFVMVGCTEGQVSVVPPAKTSTTLRVQYRINFDQASSDTIRAADGDNLVANQMLSDPAVLFDGGSYRMWFTAVIKPNTSEQELGTAYAESKDGIAWQPTIAKGSGEPILVLRPTAGGWDGGGVETPSVVKGPDAKYRLYYTGSWLPKDSHRWSIGMAISDHGSSWTKVGTKPLLDGRGTWEGPFTDGGQHIGGVAEPSVLYDADAAIYKMWYAAFGTWNSKLAYRIGYATSRDGVDWTRQTNPVFEPEATGAWDDVVVSHVSVVKRPKGGGYDMFYFGASAENFAYGEKHGAAMTPGAIGHAYSADGITWQRDANPVLNIVPGTWKAWMVGGPCALIKDRQLKLWYFGSAVYNTHQFKIGHVTVDLP